MPKLIKLHKLANGQREVLLDHDKLDADRNLLTDPTTTLHFLVDDTTITLRDGRVTTQLRDVEPLLLPHQLAIFGEELPQPELAQIRQILSGEASANNIQSRISAIEQELGQQRSLDQKRLAVDQLRSEITELQANLSAVAGLQQKLAEGQQVLGQLAGEQVATEAQVSELKRLMLQDLGRSLARTGNRLSAAVRSAQQYAQALPLWPLALLALVILGFAVVQALRVKDVAVVFIGLLVVVAQGVLIMLIARNRAQDLSPGDPEFTMPLSNDIQLVGSDTRAYLASHHLGSDITKVFADNALSDAYREEVERLNQVLSRELEGRSSDELKSELNQKEQQLSQLETVLAEIPVISPDDYLRKRRELDMLRMEAAEKGLAAGSTWLTLANYIFQNASELGIDLRAEVGSIKDEVAVVQELLLRLYAKITGMSQFQYLWPIIVHNNLASLAQQIFVDIRQVVIIN